MGTSRDIGHEYPVLDHALVEQVVDGLRHVAPDGWSVLRAQLAPQGNGSVASVTVHGQAQPLSIPVPVLGIAAEHQRRAAAAGWPWDRLVIECSSDGRLSAAAEPTSNESARRGPRTSKLTIPRTRLRAVFAVVAVVGFTMAGWLFASAWRWSPPPEADVINVPPPSPRQQQALDLITRYYEAQARLDVPAMRAVTCAQPSGEVWTGIRSLEQNNPQSITIADGIVAFRDDGTQAEATALHRIRGISDRVKEIVAEEQRHRGFFALTYRFVDEAGSMKLCGTA